MRPRWHIVGHRPDSAVVGTIALTVVAVLAAAAGAVAATRRPGRVAPAHVVRAGAAAGFVGLLGVGAIVVVNGVDDVFGYVHLLYLGVTVTLPLVGAATLGLAVRRGAPLLVWLVAVVALVPAPVGAYATHVAPFRLRVDRHVVPIDPERAGDDEVTIAVLADLQTNHIGRYERFAVDEVLAADPDVILVPGDVFQGDRGELARELESVQELLGRLDAPGGVWFVRGDADGGGHDDIQGNIDAILPGLDIGVLNDRVDEIVVGDRTIRIGGTRLDDASATADEVRAELADEPDDGAITLLMSHRPDTALRLPPDGRVDLTVAGHTHGGQVAVPGFGPIVTMSAIPRDVAAGGLHRLDGNLVYVSTGVGVVRSHAPQVRLFTRPSVGILTLRDS